jgi:NCAIR mutase (PurE)-related protein
MGAEEDDDEEGGAGPVRKRRTHVPVLEKRPRPVSYEKSDASVPKAKMEVTHTAAAPMDEATNKAFLSLVSTSFSAITTKADKPDTKKDDESTKAQAEAAPPSPEQKEEEKEAEPLARKRKKAETIVEMTPKEEEKPKEIADAATVAVPAPTFEATTAITKGEEKKPEPKGPFSILSAGTSPFGVAPKPVDATTAAAVPTFPFGATPEAPKTEEKETKLEEKKVEEPKPLATPIAVPKPADAIITATAVPVFSFGAPKTEEKKPEEEKLKPEEPATVEVPKSEEKKPEPKGPFSFLSAGTSPFGIAPKPVDATTAAAVPAFSFGAIPEAPKIEQKAEESKPFTFPIAVPKPADATTTATAMPVFSFGAPKAEEKKPKEEKPKEPEPAQLPAPVTEEKKSASPFAFISGPPSFGALATSPAAPAVFNFGATPAAPAALPAFSAQPPAAAVVHDEMEDSQSGVPTSAAPATAPSFGPPAPAAPFNFGAPSGSVFPFSGLSQAPPPATTSAPPPSAFQFGSTAAPTSFAAPQPLSINPSTAFAAPALPTTPAFPFIAQPAPAPMATATATTATITATQTFSAPPSFGFGQVTPTPAATTAMPGSPAGEFAIGMTAQEPRPAGRKFLRAKRTK